MTEAWKRHHLAARAQLTRDRQETGGQLRLLAVGTPGATARALDPSDLAVVAFQDISAATLALYRPDVVLSPVVGPGFDCIDLAAALLDAGFTGRYRAAAMEIPDPGVIRREVAAAFPGLDFDILQLGDSGRSGHH